MTFRRSHSEHGIRSRRVSTRDPSSVSLSMRQERGTSLSSHGRRRDTLNHLSKVEWEDSTAHGDHKTFLQLPIPKIDYQLIDADSGDSTNDQNKGRIQTEQKRQLRSRSVPSRRGKFRSPFVVDGSEDTLDEQILKTKKFVSSLQDDSRKLYQDSQHNSRCLDAFLRDDINNDNDDTSLVNVYCDGDEETLQRQIRRTKMRVNSVLQESSHMLRSEKGQKGLGGDDDDDDDDAGRQVDKLLKETDEILQDTIQELVKSEHNRNSWHVRRAISMTDSDDNGSDSCDDINDDDDDDDEFANDDFDPEEGEIELKDDGDINNDPVNTVGDNGYPAKTDNESLKDASVRTRTRARRSRVASMRGSAAALPERTASVTDQSAAPRARSRSRSRCSTRLQQLMSLTQSANSTAAGSSALAAQPTKAAENAATAINPTTQPEPVQDNPAGPACVQTKSTPRIDENSSKEKYGAAADHKDRSPTKTKTDVPAVFSPRENTGGEQIDKGRTMVSSKPNNDSHDEKLQDYVDDSSISSLESQACENGKPSSPADRTTGTAGQNADVISLASSMSSIVEDYNDASIAPEDRDSDAKAVADGRKRESETLGSSSHHYLGEMQLKGCDSDNEDYEDDIHFDDSDFDGFEDADDNSGLQRKMRGRIRIVREIRTRSECPANEVAIKSRELLQMEDAEGDDNETSDTAKSNRSGKSTRSARSTKSGKKHRKAAKKAAGGKKSKPAAAGDAEVMDDANKSKSSKKMKKSKASQDGTKKDRGSRDDKINNDIPREIHMAAVGTDSVVTANTETSAQSSADEVRDKSSRRQSISAMSRMLKSLGNSCRSIIKKNKSQVEPLSVETENADSQTSDILSSKPAQERGRSRKVSKASTNERKASREGADAEERKSKTSRKRSKSASKHMKDRKVAIRSDASTRKERSVGLSKSARSSNSEDDEFMDTMVPVKDDLSSSDRQVKTNRRKSVRSCSSNEGDGAKTRRRRSMKSGSLGVASGVTGDSIEKPSSAERSKSKPRRRRSNEDGTDSLGSIKSARSKSQRRKPTRSFDGKVEETAAPKNSLLRRRADATSNTDNGDRNTDSRSIRRLKPRRSKSNDIDESCIGKHMHRSSSAHGLRKVVRAQSAVVDSQTARAIEKQAGAGLATSKVPLRCNSTTVDGPTSGTRAAKSCHERSVILNKSAPIPKSYHVRSGSSEKLAAKEDECCGTEASSSTSSIQSGTSPPNRRSSIAHRISMFETSV